ncbi:hypothetical protein NSA50_17065 [Clostridium sp. DSM 100503]|uniref:hypothetical protein n=1 Tax=Clostridium sp. DSM 100503 TaxID=2963282 RepID=UPI00214A3F8F|nr:hypothetical protein [Clostridium sp. DSM 100503]MCR1952736.1 hypothetical protein [Clostridium sp. DSM 100503]
MLKSIAMVSEELGVSKASIYKKLKDEKYRSLILMENGKMMIGEELIELLKPRKSKVSKVEIIKDVEIVAGKEIIKENNNETMLDFFIKQIKEKDNQITKLYELIENNQIILDRKEQIEQEQLKLEEHFKEIDRKLIEIRDKGQNKKRLFWSFFKRKEKEL